MFFQAFFVRPSVPGGPAGRVVLSQVRLATTSKKGPKKRFPPPSGFPVYDSFSYQYQKMQHFTARRENLRKSNVKGNFNIGIPRDHRVGGTMISRFLVYDTGGY